MRTMHLFAGVGGGLLADLILGHTPIIAVEWDKYCCQVLRERAADGWFPKLRVWEGDVRLFDPSEYAGQVDCIHAGFPCQDISVAGNQAGLGEGTRSGLYREVLRIAGIVRPRYLFLENVSAILSNGLGTVLADLAAMGYDSRWICIRASDVGAPHHRDRWWCLADSNNSRVNRLNGFRDNGIRSAEGKERRGQQGIELGAEGSTMANTGHAGICQRGFVGDAGEQMQHESGIFGDGLSRSSEQEGEVLAYADDKRQLQQERSFGNQWRRIGDSGKDVADTDSAQREREQLTLRSIEEHTDTIIGSWWQLESLVGRVANGVPYRVGKLKGLGNAQVPLQAAVAWRLLGGE